jgi:hypothetical protein
LEQNKDYERNLQMSATYSTDRKHLYKTIKKLKSFKLAPQNVILGEDFLELTELSNIERLLAERQISEVVQKTTNFEPLSSDFPLDIDDNSLSQKNNLDDIFDLSNLSQNFDNQSDTQKNEDKEIDSLLGHLITEFKHIDSENTYKENEKELENTLHYFNDEEDMKDDDDIIIDEELRMMAKKENSSSRVNLVEELPVIQLLETNEKENIQEMKKTRIEQKISNQNKTPTIERTVKKAAFDTKPTFTEWLSQFRMTQSKTTNGAAKIVDKTTQSIKNESIKSAPISEVVRKTSLKSMGAIFETKNEVPDNLFGLADETPRIHFDDDDEEDEVFSEYETIFAKRKKLRPMHQLAAKSLVQDNDLVSETLADLLVWQGNGEKAKEMYRKLILRFPEKSSYFAAKIEKIK